MGRAKAGAEQRVRVMGWSGKTVRKDVLRRHQVQSGIGAVLAELDAVPWKASAL